MVAIAPPPAGKIDKISAESYRALLADLFERNFAEWRQMGHREFAETVLQMPDTHGATRAFSFSYAPYQLEPYLEIFNPRNTEVDMMMASRLGKSRIVLSALGYVIKEEPCRIGVMWPVEGDGKLWSKDDFMGELVEPTPEIAVLIEDATGQRKSRNTLLHKQFRGGLLQILGANAPGRMRRMKARVLYADEIDAIVEITTDEGDQLKIFAKRGSEYPDCIQVYCSYPSLKRRSRIEAKMLSSDFRKWFVTCIVCGGEPYVMLRSHLRYDREKPENARLECPRCGNFLNDAQRFAMMMGGDPKKPRFDLWRPSLPYRGRAGFHANSLLWPHPVDPIKFPGGYLQVLAQKEIEVETSENPERARRVLVNTDDAETYEAEFEHKPEHSALFLRREEYDPAVMLPEGVLAVFFFVDVQGDRLELFIDGFGQKNQIWALDYQVIKGTPLAPPDQGCWAELDRVISQTQYAHPSGVYLKFSGGLIDCGYKPDHVFAFTRPRSRYRIFASRGATSLGKPIIGRRPKREGNPPAKVWELGTNEAKDIIYQRLEIDNQAANGYQHFPKLGQFSEIYFAMLVAEDSEMKRAGDGKFYRAFSCENGVRNEALDGRVGTMAAERIVKPKYAQLAIELAVKPDGNEPETKQEPAEVKQTAPQTKRFGPRLHPRGRGGFVQGWR